MNTDNERSDADLLQAYGRDGDEAAFEALARRHVDMIFSVSFRRSGNRQIAEEATQNVLIALTNKALKFSEQDSNLTAWLHTSTKFEVSKLRRREDRIRKREQAYATEIMKTSTHDEEESFRHLLPLLDTAIDNLRAPDREVIVRRYLEGQDFRRIGEALGISEDAAQKRTSRAFDALNQFFRRKAGVTVTATALATGIGQHCAEAAPAACLQFTSSGASAGVASLFTIGTITTMSIGKITAVAAGVIAVGGAIALLNTNDITQQETVSTSPPPGSAPAVPALPQPIGQTVAANAKDPDAAAASGKPYSPNEELAKLEAMSPHPSPDEMARRLSVKHGQLLEDLTKDLGLSAGQSASLKEVLDRRLKDFRASLETGPQPSDDHEESMNNEMLMLTKAGGIIKGDGLRAEIAGILSADQLAAFDEREADRWQSQVESLAYRELSTLTPVLNLTDEQKDRTFELLQKSSGENLRESEDVRAFMALQKNQAPAKLDLTDMAEAKFLSETMDGPNALDPESPEFRKQITKVVGGQIDRKVALLAPVLDEPQQQRYRDHLVSKSVLPMFGIKLPTPEEK